MALLVLALVAGLVIVGALNRPVLGVNGLLLVSVRGQLEAIDPGNGSARQILPPGEKAEGVSRSPDGRIATFWVNEPGRSHLFAIGVDGQDRRELASSMSVTWNPSIDTWSSDSRFLATEVTLDGTARILIVDVTTGAARPVTPKGVVAHNPLWSPDARWIAFTPETSTGFGLSVIRTDGTEMHDVAGDLHGFDVAGPDTWSPDGQWIYFNAGNSTHSRVFRANVPGRFSQPLTRPTNSMPMPRPPRPTGPRSPSSSTRGTDTTSGSPTAMGVAPTGSSRRPVSVAGPRTASSSSSAGNRRTTGWVDWARSDRTAPV